MAQQEKKPFRPLFKVQRTKVKTPNPELGRGVTEYTKQLVEPIEEVVFKWNTYKLDRWSCPLKKGTPRLKIVQQST